MLRLNSEKSDARNSNSVPTSALKIVPRQPDTRPSVASNDLICRLSPQSRRLLLARCQPVPLTAKQVLQERGLPLRYAYFLEAGAASLTTRAGDSSPVEIYTLGKKDLVGITLVLGVRISPHRCTVQVRGRALRIEAEALVDLIKSNVEIEKLLLRYVQATLVHSAQLVACNSRHNLNQRLARWLLVARDRMDANEIAITHRCIAQAIGVRRAGITTAIGELEAAGLVRSGRKRITIVDETRMEETSCNCYRVIRSAQESSLCGPVALRIVHSCVR